MTTTDYVIDIVLILVIFRQLRTRELTPRSVILPLVLVVYAGTRYLHHFSLGGNDLALIIALAATGTILGALSGVATSVWRDETGTVLVRAGALAVATWIAGMGFRFLFAVYANSRSGRREVARISARHAITSGQVWTTALVLMAFGEVLARVAVLQIRRLRHLNIRLAT